MKLLSAYVIGLVFGIGIAISGMVNPAKVVNFFDLAGNWDPSLAFVMGGGVIVSFIGYRLVFKRSTPLLAAQFSLPDRTDLDVKLLVGAAVFGIGWGIAGFCPGGALPALGTGKLDVIAFVAALLVGMFLTRYLTKTLSKA